MDRPVPVIPKVIIYTVQNNQKLNIFLNNLNLTHSRQTLQNAEMKLRKFCLENELFVYYWVTIIKRVKLFNGVA